MFTSQRQNDATFQTDVQDKNNITQFLIWYRDTVLVATGLHCRCTGLHCRRYRAQNRCTGLHCRCTGLHCRRCRAQNRCTGLHCWCCMQGFLCVLQGFLYHYYYYFRGLKQSFTQRQSMIQKDQNTNDHSALTIGNGDPMHEVCIPHRMLCALKQ